jgi:hypothetical protein
MSHVENDGKSEIIAEEMDRRHVDLHTDCVSFDLATGIIAVTCYQLNESDSSSDPQHRAGKVFFYLNVSGMADQITLHDLQIKYKGFSDFMTFLPVPAGIFDIRWSQRAVGDVGATSSMVLALSDGTLRRFKVSVPFPSLSAFHLATKDGHIPQSIEITEESVYQPEMEGDLALGVDVARIFDQSDSTSFDVDEEQDDQVNRAENNDVLNISSEYAAVGYQSGAIAVFDLYQGSRDPVWSCAEAHMAEVWQTQWLFDASYDPFIESSKEAQNWHAMSQAYGRRTANLFVSGSDDASFKLWDVRCDPSSGAVAMNRKHFQMGVTSFASPLASPCLYARSLLPFNLLVGSYDESLSLWDIRNIGKPIDEISLGGGVWRLRWLPTLPMTAKGTETAILKEETGFNDREVSYLAVATMHAGFKVVSIANPNISEAESSISPSQSRFKEVSCYWGPHKGSVDGKFPPLAYGLDWSVRPGTRFGPGLAASLVACTFYDNCISSYRL